MHRFRDWVARSPLDDFPTFGHRSRFLIVNVVLFFLWLLRELTNFMGIHVLPRKK